MVLRARKDPRFIDLRRELEDLEDKEESRGRSYYDVLGVRRNATVSEIKRAYRAAAKRYHPDVTEMDVSPATRRFREATDAYEVLTDPERRRAYDHDGQAA